MSASAVGAHAIKQISPAHIPNSAVLHSIALLHMLCSLVMDPELRELYNITVDRIEKAGFLQSTSAGKPRASGLAVEFSRGGVSVGPAVSRNSGARHLSVRRRAPSRAPAAAFVQLPQFAVGFRHLGLHGQFCVC